MASKENTMDNQSCATTRGEWYNVKVAALLYLRSKNNSCISRFQLGANVKEARGIGDIVYRSVSIEDPHNWHTSFVKLEHKEQSALNVDSFTCSKGGFSVLKCLKSYKEIKTTKLTEEKFGLFGGSFDLFRFVIYTNLKVDDEKLTEIIFCEDKLEGEPVKSGYLEKLLMSNNENELVFKFKRETNEDVFSFLEEVNDTGDDVNDFLEKLTVFTGQPTETELDDVIQKELVVACGGAVNDAGAIYRIFEELFKQWWRDSKDILDETSDIVQRAIDQLNSEAELTIQTDICSFELCFNENSLKCYSRSFFDGSSLVHITTETTMAVAQCATKVLQFLKTERLTYIFISLENLLKHQNTLVPEWKDGRKDWLVVVNDSREDYCKEMLSGLSMNITDILRENPQKKVIVASPLVCALVGLLKESISKDKHKVIEFTFDFSDLDEASQQKIFEKEVIFQDHKINLHSLYYDGDLHFWESLLSADFIASLISIGEKLPNPIPHVVPRRLKIHTYLNVEILKSEMLTDVFAVSGVNVQELQRLVTSEEKVIAACDLLGTARNSSSSDPHKAMFVVLDPVNAGKEYNELCQNHSNVHEIHVEQDSMKWVRSNGSIYSVKQFIDSSRETIIQSESVMDTDSRACLLVGDPGMGKSTLIPVLAQAAKTANPSNWVICINLRDHIELFNRSLQLGALEFLTSAMRIDKPFEQALLRDSLEQTGNIIVLLDSFDEICPRFKEEGCALLMSILNTAVKKVVVTSRRCIQGILEERLSTLAYHIVDFSEEDKQTCFRQLWSQISSPMTGTQLEFFIAKLIHSMNSIEPEKQLIGTPLQIMILAGVFQNHVNDPENYEFPESLDLLNLIEQFVDEKCMTFFRNGKTNLNMDDSKKKFFEYHTQSALSLLIPNKDLQCLVTHQTIVTQADDLDQSMDAAAKDRSGMIVRMVNNKPSFIHQIFVEYFSGVWFSDNFHSNTEFLRNHLFQPNYKVIRSMLDRILANGHKVHEAVLDKDMLLLERLMDEEGVDVNSLDRGCRTPLHLAAAMGFHHVNPSFGYHSHDERFIGPRSRHMVEILLEKGAAVNVIDAVLKWSPLEYAFKTRSWDALEYLLGSNAHSGKLSVSETLIQNGDVLKMILLNKFINLFTLFLEKGLRVRGCTYHTQDQDNDEHCESLLHTASHFGHIEFVELLLSRGADKRARDTHENVPLHIAALYGHLPVVRALVETRSKVAISTLKNKLKSFRRYVNSVNESGQSALHAAMNGEIVSALISYGANIWISDYRNRLCLHTACCHGRLSSVQSIIESIGQKRRAIDKLINSLDIDGKSPMWLASKYGHSEIVMFLVSQGADVWPRDVKSARTSLHLAIDTSSTCVVEALLENVGKDRCELEKFLDATDVEDKSALNLALIEENTDLVRLLVSYGAKVSEFDNKGRTSLHYARNSTMAKILIESLGEDKEEVVKYVNIQDREGISALCVASKAGYSDVVLILISYWANVWALDKRGRTSLHYAGNGEVAHALIGGLRGDKDEVRKLVNVLDHEGISAMILASKQGRLAVAEILVLHGADVWARDERGRTGLHYPGNTDLTKAILDSFAEDKKEIFKYVNTLDNDGISAMVIASTQGYSDIAEILVSHGADAWARNKLGRTSLHYAKSKNVAQALIESAGESSDGVTKYVNTLDNEGISALMLASQNGHSEVAQLLISHRADVWTRTKAGKTCLHYATNGDVAEALIDGVGKDIAEVNKYVNTLDKDNVSSLIVASMKGYAGVVRVLGLHGSDVWARDTRGRTSLHHASKSKVVHALAETLKGNNDDLVKYVNAVDHENKSAMHLACLFDFPKVLRLLISYGGDVWARDKNGRTCLHDVLENRKLPLAQIIIDSFGRDKERIAEYVNVKDVDGITALDIAVASGTIDSLCMNDHVAFDSSLGDEIEENDADSQPIVDAKSANKCVIQ